MKPKITYKEITLILGIIIALLVAYTLSGNYHALRLSSLNSLLPRITIAFPYENVMSMISDFLR